MTDWRSYSRLPTADEYWEGLANKIEARRTDSVISLRAASVMAFLSAAAAIVVLLQPARADADNATALLAPSDPVAQAFVLRNEPPRITEILAHSEVQP